MKIFESVKPVIAAINGPAVGVGITMTLAMDIRIASYNASFGLVFARRGIIPEACSTWFLPRIVGISKALEWVLSGRVFTGEEALRSGLVRSLHSPSDLLPSAEAIAREIAENTSAISVALSRQMLWQMLGAQYITFIEDGLKRAEITSTEVGEIRSRLRDALESTEGLQLLTSIYTMSPEDHFGQVEQTLVIVTYKDGELVYLP